MLSVRFLNCFNILSDFCFGWLEIAPPWRSHCHSSSLSPVLCRVVVALALGPFVLGYLQEGGPHARPDPLEEDMGFPTRPGVNGNGPKGFRETPCVPEADLSPGVREEVLRFWHLESLRAQRPHIGYCRSWAFLQSPRALSGAPVHETALFLVTNTWASRLLHPFSWVLDFFSVFVGFCFETLVS